MSLQEPIKPFTVCILESIGNICNKCFHINRSLSFVSSTSEISLYIFQN